MAKPYKEGAGWAIRLRVRGHDLYLSGFKSAAQAREAAARRSADMKKAGVPLHDGPDRTTLGRAFLLFAKERLPFLKAASKDANRINAYLRAGGLPVIALEKNIGLSAEGTQRYWDVQVLEETARKIPNSLKAHRKTQKDKTSRTTAARQRLVGMKMADITPTDIAAVLDAMSKDGLKQATRCNEHAELRRLFYHARRVWRWTEPGENPVSAIKLETPDNARDRVLTNAEWQRVLEALRDYENPYVVPTVALLLETAMRSSEALVLATWGDVDWGRNVLQLRDAKEGARKVPLGPGAMEILQTLKERAGRVSPNERILKTSYEAVKKAWRVACEEAGVMDVQLHDLRHTSATRFSLEYHGDISVLKKITGHKTTEMLMRYINLKAEDVAAMMHGRQVDEAYLPAGYRQDLNPFGKEVPAEGEDVAAEPVPRTPSTSAVVPTEGRVVSVDFRARKRSA